MMHHSNSLIYLKDLCKTYESQGIAVRALHKLNLSFQKAEFCAICGPSGSGKTTLLNMIGALDKASAGEIFLKGRSITESSEKELSKIRRDEIGFIFQLFNLIPVLSVEENVEYVLQLQGIKKSERKRRVHALLSELGLEGLQKRFPRELSGGQQQRVAIARAMLAEPSLILADEPSANLDSKTAEKLLQFMRRLNVEKKMTFLFSTHDPMIKEQAKRVITLKDGQVLDDTAP